MKISIPEPCSEDWSKMTPTEQGAFCQKCALEVTDFTNKSSLEIKSILTEKIQSKKRVCGHIENRQLIEFNHGYIPWKSNQESFRAVWMFSLVAVFGMTLFSCQSTFSKEMVEQMRTTSEVLMEENRDTLDIAQLKDSIMEMTSLDSLQATVSTPWPWVQPYEITGGPVIMDGGMDLELRKNDCKIEIYTVWNGTFVVSGMTQVAPTSEEQAPLNRVEFMFNPMEPAPTTPITQSPRVNERNQQDTQRIDAKLEKGKPEFDAYISPNPIEETSKLYLTIPEEGTLKLSIWELGSLSKLHAETFDLVFGNHTVDINFQDFPQGKYATQLIWEEEKVVLPFEVLGKDVS